ncbi:hypothetical protein J2D73_11800 [Acetobacter sacchari]|uniref:Uncharacterized protein n=1 Tax=Acetobacter sacchari TaxID=2661687 RepID=A0ABS3LX29_9PROT|nr:hypothetical protein [Acetobacter sacchari]MBO1360472.1 hypothetical protein [Acetobacter sacchari]
MLISDEIAVVPVGVSCINGYQIARLKNRFEKKFGCSLIETSSFFRFIYQNPQGISKFFEKYVFLEENISSYDILIENHSSQAPYIPETGTWFVHDEPERLSRETGVVRSIDEIILHVRSKYSYLLEKMRALKHKKNGFLFLETRIWSRVHGIDISMDRLTGSLLVRISFLSVTPFLKHTLKERISMFLLGVNITLLTRSIFARLTS